jgi:argininosuccinate lyase
MTWFVFIESNTSGTGRLFAQNARDMGFRPVLLAANPARYPYVAEDALDTRRLDTLDQSAVVAACRQLAADGGLAGVASSSEYFIPMVAAVTAELGLPGPRLDVIQTCRNKAQQRMRLFEAQVGVPAFRLVTSVTDAVSAADDLGYPVVVKPVSGSGSVGVKYCETTAEVDQHARELLSQGQNERGMATQPEALVEALAVGPEFSVETFGDTIIGITQKHLGALPYFVEIGHDFPATLPAETAAAICDTVQRTLQALEFTWGGAHIELRLTKSGPVIIEVNPRLAGGFIPELVRLATGINLITEMVRLTAGAKPQLTKTVDRSASIRFILPPHTGTLAEVNGLDAVRREPAIADLRLYAAVGSRVQRNGDFRDRIGHIIACSDSAEQTRQAVEAAHQAVGLVVQPDTSSR